MMVIPYIKALNAFLTVYKSMPISLQAFINTFFCIYLGSILFKILTTRT